MSPTTYRKLGEIRANSPYSTSEDAYAQMAAAKAYSRSLAEPHAFQGDGPECELCLRGRNAKRHGGPGDDRWERTERIAREIPSYHGVSIELPRAE